MLVLKRALMERLVIGSDIFIQVVEIRPGCVRLGVTAPKEVIVDREEIHEARRRGWQPAVVERSPDAAPIRTRRDARRGPGGRV